MANMRSQVRYAITGIFVIILTLAMIAAIMWMTLGTEKIATKRYVIYMTESVAGLAEKAPVKMRGVDVGKVAKVGLDPINPWRVKVLIDLNEDTPVVEGMRAELIVSAITWVGYLELSGGSNGNASIPIIEGDEYPRIPVKRSLSTRLENVFDTLTDRIEKISRRLTTMLSVKNLDHFSNTLNNLEKVTSLLSDESGGLQKGLDSIALLGTIIEDHKGDLNATFVNAAAISDNLADMTANLASLSKRMETSVSLLDGTLKTISQSTSSIGHLAEDGTTIVRQFGQQMIPSLQTTLNELNQLAEDGQLLLQDIQANPQSLLFGSAPRPAGPGE
jgi:phospholipid/cholesterol/gamma-HCH transport system substrate-binding protein